MRNIAFDIIYNGTFHLENYQFTKMVIECIIVGLGNISGTGQGILVVALQLGVAPIIWFLFMAYYRKEAKKLNNKIQSMK